jgi:hypothetical protein
MDKQIFISYSHQDERWRERLLAALAPVARQDEIDVWSDAMIQPGEDWRQRIDQQIQRSNVAVLLVTARFLASDFIDKVELPRLVAAAEEGRLTLLWVPVSASVWEVTPLSRFQAVIDANEPLDQMSRAKADQALVTVARHIGGGRTLTNIGRAMHVIDEAFPELEEDAGTPRRGPFGVVARHTGTSVAFESRDETRYAFEVITYQELGNLPEEDHRLIQALETSMYNEWERWTSLRSRRSTLTDYEHREFEASGRAMCNDLGSILDFLERQLNKSLEDHYHGIRWACEKVTK